MTGAGAVLVFLGAGSFFFAAAVGLGAALDGLVTVTAADLVKGTGRDLLLGRTTSSSSSSSSVSDSDFTTASAFSAGADLAALKVA